ncbi:MAG TPA: hypothetical protein VF212_12555 [Longimicrobiales bacterium]
MALLRSAERIEADLASPGAGPGRVEPAALEAHRAAPRPAEIVAVMAESAPVDGR